MQENTRRIAGWVLWSRDGWREDRTEEIGEREKGSGSQGEEMAVAKPNLSV